MKKKDRKREDVLAEAAEVFVNLRTKSVRIMTAAGGLFYLSLTLGVDRASATINPEKKTWKIHPGTKTNQARKTLEKILHDFKGMGWQAKNNVLA